MVDRLLTSLEDLVRRHRALAADGQDGALHVELVAADVTSEDQVQAVIDRIVEAGLPLRAAVNCAGVGLTPLRTTSLFS